MSATHQHVIDGKVSTYQNGKCPFCNPETSGTQQSSKQPTAYMKGNTVVLHISGAFFATVNYYKEGGTYLLSVNEIARDGAGKLMRDGQNNPIWKKMTRRVPPQTLKDFIYQLSVLVKNTEGNSGVPKRD